MFSKIKSFEAINGRNVLYTVLCNLNHFSYGIICHIFGNSLVDLQYIYSVSVDTIAYIPMAQSVGYLVGAMIGWVYKWLNRQLTASIFFMAMSITLAFSPFYHSFALLFVCVVISGIGSGAWNASSGAWLIDLWPVGNAAVLQFFQFMYGIGTIISPLLVAPFVYGKNDFDEGANRTISIDDRIRSLTIPFAISGVSGLIVPLIMIALYFVWPYRKMEIESVSKPMSESVETISIATIDERERSPHRLIKLAMCGLAAASYSAVELGWFSFSSAMYQNLPIEMTASNGAHMIAIFSTTFTLGRLATAAIALKLSPDIILSYHFVILFGSLAALFVGRDNATIIYVANGFYGFGCSAIWPAIFAFTECHLRISDRICSVFSVITGSVTLLVPLVLGQTFEAHPLILFALEAGFIALCCALFVTVRVWIFFDRTSKKEFKIFLCNLIIQ